METRRINDSMGTYVAERVVCLMNKKGLTAKNAHILVLGFTFKENCPDIRNTRVSDLVATLREYTANIDILDPWADPAEVKRTYGIDIISDAEIVHARRYDAIILDVAHDCFKSLDIHALAKPESVIYDVKGVLERNIVTNRL